MKKFILLLGISLSLAIGLQAQSYNVKFDATETFRSFTGIVASDTIKGTAEIGKTFLVAKDYKYGYQSQIKVLRTAADSTVKVNLYGSLDGSKFYTISTVVWKMTTADTTILFTDVTGVGWRYLRNSIKGNKANVRAKLGELYLGVFKIN
jgi:hypothetical protein